MSLNNKRIRLASCVETIIEVHTNLDPENVDSIFFTKFKQLEVSLKSMQVDVVSEADVARVEEATNRLLKELGRLVELDSTLMLPGAMH